MQGNTIGNEHSSPTLRRAVEEATTALALLQTKAVAQPGFHWGGGVRALGAGPQVLRAPRFSISAASVGLWYLLRAPGIWLLIEPEVTLDM